MMEQASRSSRIDEIDRQIITATQDGLPLVRRPFEALAKQIGVTEDTIKIRLNAMLECGIIRRIGVVPNHYRLGYTANGMSVWDVDDNSVDELGEVVGALDYVSHCYRRPRHLPLWPYNLFAMVHGKTKDEVEEKVAAIKALLGAASRSSDILYSSKILKKTGLRLRERQDKKCSD